MHVGQMDLTLNKVTTGGFTRSYLHTHALGILLKQLNRGLLNLLLLIVVTQNRYITLIDEFICHHGCPYWRFYMFYSIVIYLNNL